MPGSTFHWIPFQLPTVTGGIEHRIALGGLSAIRSGRASQLPWTHVFTILNQVEPTPTIPGVLCHHRYSFEDSIDEIDEIHFMECYQEFEKSLLDVLVTTTSPLIYLHCFAGQSRSVAFLILFLIRQHVCPNYHEAHAYVAQYRDCIYVNGLFRDIIEKLEKT
jgi:hypothetical protein